MKTKHLLLSLLAFLIPLTSFADVWQDPETKVNYEYTPGSGEASVKKGEYDYNYYKQRAGSPSVSSDITILSSFTVYGTDYRVTSIGMYAFYDCSNLVSVTIPNSVTTICSYAFSGCSGLTSITIPEGVKTIIDHVFTGCSSLNNVIIPNSVTSIGNSTFENCKNLTSVSIGNSLTSTGLYTFNGCVSLTSVFIPKSVRSIGVSAFQGCVSLTSIHIPDSVTNIGGSAFNGCSSLVSFNIPGSVTSIGQFAFLRTGWYDNQPEGQLYHDNWLLGFKNTMPEGAYVVSEEIRGIAGAAFLGCSGLTSITIPNNVKYIGERAFSDCSNLTSADLDCDTIENWFALSSVKSVVLRDNVKEIGKQAFQSCRYLNTINLPNSVRSIGSQAFEGCVSLSSITIPNNVTSIGWSVFKETRFRSINLPNSITIIPSSAFDGCSNLQSIVMGDSVKEIGSNAFYKCSSLNKINIPNSLTTIGSNAFYGCQNLTTIESLHSVEYIWDYAFYECKRLNNITFGDSLKRISDYAFRNCSELSSVIIPNSVAYLGTDAFGDCISLKSAQIDATITEIPQYAFYGCYALTTVNIPNTITSIGAHAFQGCSALTSITIPNTVVTIGASAFNNCRGITSITIPTSVTSIQEDAFSYCTALSSITIPKSVTRIEGWTFMGCSSLMSVSIPDQITSIGYAAFASCTKLTSVTIPDAVTSIREKVFIGCSNLTSIKSLISNPYPINDVFDNTTYTNATLYVPVGTLYSYKYINGWKNFKNIEEDVMTTNLIILDDMGNDVTEHVKVCWYDEGGNIISKKNTITTGDNAVIYYSVTLDEEMGRVYREVSHQKVVVDGTPVTCQLKRIEDVTIHGKVTGLGVGLPRAKISMTQWLNGRYEQTGEALTDSIGEFTIEAKNDSTELFISYSGYLDKTVNRKHLNSGGELGTIEMEQAKGKVAVISLTYQDAFREGTTPTIQDWYDDTRNIAYSVRNITKDSIVEFAMQQGNIVMRNGVETGDRIAISATSLNGRFVDVSSEGIIGENDTTNVTLHLVQHGGIEVNYESNIESHLQVLLFNSSGCLVARSSFSSQQALFKKLESGNYSLIIASNRIGSIATLTDLDRMRLNEGSDYIQISVTVSNGIISVINVNEELSEVASHNDILLANSSYISEKQELVEGNYVTLAALVSVNELYSESFSDINLEIDIPDGCTFFDGSLVIGNKVSPYVLEDNRLIVPIGFEDLGKRVRFCVVPQKAGEFTSTAFVSFSYNGENYISIGSASFNVEEGKIAVPEKTGGTMIPITGIVPAHADVDIYDNDHLISSVKAKGDGSFNKFVELYQPYNLSTHYIYAKYSTEGGIQRTTITHECFYEKASSEVKTVTMSFYNGWMRKNISLTFDFENGVVSDKSYQFYHATDFTFIADLTTNDMTSVDGVTFYVHTTAKEVRVLKGFFNAEIGRWVAVERFESNNLPVNLTVNITPNSKSHIPEADTQQTTDLLADIQAYVVTALAEREELDKKESLIEGEINKATLDASAVKEFISQYAGFDFDGEKSEGNMTENFDQCLAQLTEQTNSLVNVADDFLNNGLEQYQKYYNADETLEDGSTMTKLVGTCEGLTVDELTTKGYKVIPSTEGVLLAYMGENMLDYVDFHNNIRFTLTLKQGYLKEWNALYDAVQKALATVLADRDNINRWLNLAMAERQRIQELLTTTEKDYRTLLAIETDNKTLLLGLNKLEKRRALLISLSLYLGKVNEAVARLNRLIEIYRHLIVVFDKIDNFEVGDCLSENNPQAKALFEGMRDDIRKEFLDYVCWRVYMYITHKITDAKPKQLPSAIKILRMMEDAAVTIRDAQFDRYITSRLEQLYADSESAEQACESGNADPLQPIDKEAPQDDQDIAISTDNAPDPTLPSVTPIHDPSGFVYEAVTSNRLQGVTATVYYQEDGQPVQWDAEDFSQRNPIVTDETGLYHWDVPQGMWQVRFEKEGYETIQTEWLPVPPPQMEINMPMSQAVSPVVTDALGVESGITLTFSKYLKPETATAGNMTAMKEDTGEVEGNTELVNLEEDPYTSKSFVSKVTFVPKTAFTSGDVVLLTVKKEVESYCGAPLAADTTLRVVIQAGLHSIVVDSAANIGYGMSQALDVSITPAEAAAGKVVRVMCTSPMIAAVDSETVTLDDDGRAHVTITGKLPGTAALLWSVDGMDMEATTELNIITTKNKKGDVNGDGTVNQADVATIIIYLSNQTSGITQAQADVNGDGIVDVADITAVINIMAKGR